MNNTTLESHVNWKINFNYWILPFGSELQTF